jgi:glycosyltransferase involved in cell wall biosynthesis
MNILFLTLSHIWDINEQGIYTDLLRKFRDEGHMIYVATSVERRYRQKTSLFYDSGVNVLKIKILNIQKSNLIEKGIGTVFLEHQYYFNIRKHFKNVKFDLVLYTTPPITLTRVVRSLKREYSSTTYLMLKDIFPQNAVDLEMMHVNGILYRYFRKKEIELYRISDYIGVMSPANKEYLLRNNPWIDKNKVEVCPNSMDLPGDFITGEEKESIRIKHNIPLSKIVLIYGGNLGKPQGLDFLLELIRSNSKNEKIFFVISGSGTEYSKIKSWFDRNKPGNAMLLSFLPKKEYDFLVQSCEIGMIFLDKRFTIPNYPSRILNYLKFKIPVVIFSDPVSDIGKIAESNGYGFWSLNGDIESANKNISKMVGNEKIIERMGEAGFNYLTDNYTVDISYKAIIKHFEFE